VASGYIPASRPVPRGIVQSSPLPPVTAGPVARAGAIPGAVSGARFAAPAVKNPPIAGNARRVVSGQFPTGTARNLKPSGRWTPEGGTPVVLAQGETLKTMERRYGVPASTLMAVNGFKSASAVGPGTRVVIPVYNAAGAKSSASKASASKASSRDLTTGSITPARKAAIVPPSRPRHLASTASTSTQRLRAPVPAARPKVARAEPSRANRKVRQVGPAMNRETLAERRARIKAERTAKAEEKRELARREAARKERVAEKARTRREEIAARKARNEKAAERSKPVKTASVRSRETDSAVDRNPVGSIKSSSTDNFRWPAKGRVIQGFRKGANDGINIAVPEGAPIKAAESGTVAYAGSELKGYGKLVLIRHPNGYVSAYAHNSQLTVKRGDTVRRGQLIAKAGRTGNVSTPQLHFELRKGSNPVNPMKLLGSN
jgi:murein DD-endopeptidase MepM/ murein hydrolase activator NlpD